MKNAYLVCTFDPVTDAEISYARSLRKSGEYSEVYLIPSEEGILTRSERYSLLRRATAPYRHLNALIDCDKSSVPVPSYLKEGENKVREGYFRLAAKGTRKILLQNGWYMESIVNAQCRPKRAVHSRGVAMTAESLAKAHGLDEKKAYVMGMLHDITKKMSDDEGSQLIRRWKPEWENISPKVWHSYTAVLFLKREMCCTDHVMLHALEHHTLGDGRSDYDHILYIADKIEPGRGYDTSEQMALSRHNLKKGAQRILEESRKYIFEKEGIHV